MPTKLHIHLKLVESHEDQGVFEDKTLQETETSFLVNGLFRHVNIQHILAMMQAVVARFRT